MKSIPNTSLFPVCFFRWVNVCAVLCFAVHVFNQANNIPCKKQQQQHKVRMKGKLLLKIRWFHVFRIAKVKRDLPRWPILIEKAWNPIAHTHTQNNTFFQFISFVLIRTSYQTGICIVRQNYTPFTRFRSTLIFWREQPNTQIEAEQKGKNDHFIAL